MKLISFSRTVNLDILYGEALKTALTLNAGQKYFLEVPANDVNEPKLMLAI